MPRESTFAFEKGSRLSSAWTLSSSRRKIAICRPRTSAHTPVFGTMSSRRHTRIASRSCRFKFSFPFPGPCRADLAALGDEHHVAVRLVAVHEMAEALHDFGIVDRLLPFTFVAVHQLLHIRLELRADAERVFAYDLAHVVDAPFEVLQPHAGALQPVAGADVEHQEAVDVLDEGPVVG